MSKFVKYLTLTALTVILTVMLLTACAGGKEFTVTFNSNGGSECAPVSTKGNERLVLPVPAKTGYTFEGWYYDNGTFYKAFLSNTLEKEKLKDNLTVYAKWTKNSGTGTEPEPEQPAVDVSSFPFPVLTVLENETRNVKYVSKSISKTRIHSMIESVVAQWLFDIGEAPYSKPEIRFNSSATNDYLSNLGDGKNEIIFTMQTSHGEYTYVFELYIISGTTVSGKYEYVTHNDNAVILNVLSTAAAFEFPSVIGEFSLKVISPLCMASATASIITVPASVSVIGEEAFSYCSNLTAVAVNSENPVYRSAGGSLFNLDGSVLMRYAGTEKTYSVHTSVKKIAPRAFYYAYNLESVNLTDTEYFGSYAFASTANLTSVQLSGEATVISEGAFRDSGLTSFSFGDNIETVCKYAFSGTKLTAVTVPDTVKSIYDGVFSGCTALMSYSLPDSLTAIPNELFSDCQVLQAANIKPKIETIGEFAFLNCKAIQSLDLSAATALSEIKESAFQGCSSAAVLVLPDSLTLLGKKAFQNIGITELTFPAKLTAVGQFAFYGCASLKKITFPGTLEKIEASAFSNCKALETVLLSASITSIGVSAFNSCSAIPYIFIPSTVTEMGASVFGGCGSVIIYVQHNTKPTAWDKNWIDSATPVYWDISDSSIKVEDGFQYYADNDGKAVITKYTGAEANVVIPATLGGADVVTVSTRAFFGIKTIKDVSFAVDSKVTKILPYAFSQSSVEKIYFPLSLDTIAEYAFAECSKLTVAVTTVQGTFAAITTIEKFAFYKCVKLNNFSMPDTVDAISESLFAETDLRSFTLPDSIKTIGPSAFKQCVLLSNFTIGENSLLTSIGSGCFIRCESLKSITLPAGITVINDNIFNWCISLSTVTIKGAVTKIGANAFSGCSAMESITLPSTVTEIGASAFYYCTGLKTLVLPESLITIGKTAFQGCNAVTTVTIPLSVTAIEANAFYGLNDKAKIICKISLKPEGWADNWNGGTKVEWLAE